MQASRTANEQNSSQKPEQAKLKLHKFNSKFNYYKKLHKLIKITLVNRKKITLNKNNRKLNFYTNWPKVTWWRESWHSLLTTNIETFLFSFFLNCWTFSRIMKKQVLIFFFPFSPPIYFHGFQKVSDFRQYVSEDSKEKHI